MAVEISATVSQERVCSMKTDRSSIYPANDATVRTTQSFYPGATRQVHRCLLAKHAFTLEPYSILLHGGLASTTKFAIFNLTLESPGAAIMSVCV